MKLPWRRHEEPAARPPDERHEIAPQELRQLSTVFKAPPWLENLGHAAWLLVGLFGVLIGLAWFLAETYTIGGPVVAATIVATVAMPLVTRLGRHMPRAIAAVLVLVGLGAIAGLILLLRIGGITAQHQPIKRPSSEAGSKAQGWVKS